eukprot:Nk52_evm44s1737 gene=Nk52_evmTU44s1737
MVSLMKSISFVMAIVAICIAACAALPSVPPTPVSTHVSSLFSPISEEQLTSVSLTEPKWSNCTSDELFLVSSISVSPEEPVHGQELTIVVNGLLKDKFTNGTIIIDPKIWLVPDITLDPCAQSSCPMNAGPAEITVKQTLPNIRLIKGVRTVNVRVVGEDDGVQKTWSCIDVTVNIH